MAPGGSESGMYGLSRDKHTFFSRHPRNGDLQISDVSEAFIAKRRDVVANVAGKYFKPRKCNLVKVLKFSSPCSKA